jgi:hypothetical protein
MAQSGLGREYIYDAAGNRVLRKVAVLPAPPLPAPPAPQDSTYTADLSPLTTEFYVENIAHVEIKIYPNPTTEKITMEISNLENLSNGVFKLYSLSGQLLQEFSVYSSTTEVSLAGFAKGTYILKVQINDQTEDWKIIKQ